MNYTRVVIFGHEDAHKLATIAAEFGSRGPIAVLNLTGRSVDDAAAAIGFHNVQTHPVFAVINHLDADTIQALTDTAAVTPGDTCVLRLWSVADWVNGNDGGPTQETDDRIRFLAYPFFTIPYDRGEDAIAECVSQILYRSQFV